MEPEYEENDVGVKLRGHYAEKYTQDGLREAIEKIRNNELSYGAASKIYNVPKATLHNKIRNPETLPKGATTILSKEQEDELAEWVLLHADFGDPRTKQDIIIAAAEIAQLDDASGKFKNGIPTSGWMEGFLNRHPLCRERTPQGISKASAINSKDDFAGLWRNIFNYFEKTNQLNLLNKPELWWNADETCFEKDKIPKKVIARRGAKRVSRREMGPPKANTTVTYAFSAAGDYVEPLITLKDSNSSVAEIAFALGSVGANYGINQTESGWTKKESFYYFVSIHLHNQWEAKNSPKPRILTIDGYGAHFSPKLFRWCRRNAVIIIVLYPGATPYMQMCDTTMFSPMKQKHAQIYSQWRLKNPTKTMNHVEFVKILKQINDEVIKKDSIINGWRATGLQPFNFNNLNTAGLLSKSPDRVYDFKGFYIDPPPQLNATTAANDRNVNVLSDVLLDPASENYIHFDELTTVFPRLIEPTGPVTNGHYANKPINDCVQRYIAASSALDIRRIENVHVQQNIERSSALGTGPTEQGHVQRNIEHSTALDIPHTENDHVQQNTEQPAALGIGHTENGHVQRIAQQSSAIDIETEIELLEVSMDEIPEGPIRSYTHFDQQVPWNLTDDTSLHPVQSTEHEAATATNGRIRINESVTFSELAGPSDVLKSQSNARFDLSEFGMLTNESTSESQSKVGKLADKIRRDVKNLGLLCAASDKTKLINILIINQQLNAIDPPLIEEVEPVKESRTIKSVLKPPTMPQRMKQKRNLNLKVSYGVVTAKEIVQSIMDREAADLQHETEREHDDIAKIERENEITAVEEDLKSVRKLLSLTRSEAAILTKEIVQNKKRKSTGTANLEADKRDKDILVKTYDNQAREHREKLKNLKSANVAINKAVSLKRKTFEAQKKEMGNKVQPTIAPSEIDDKELDSDEY